MDVRRWVLGVAAAGVAAGTAGLGLLAVPTGAEAAPKLPPVGAEELVQSVLTSEPPALGGTVQVDNRLGLPAVPGVPQLAADGGSLRVWTDGEGRKRISVPSNGGEKTVVDDGAKVSVWDSAERTVTTFDADDWHGKSAEKARQATDPAKAARDLVAAVREHSTVTVDGTARVADRPAYALVLAPASDERTMLREIRVAVDAEHRIPLRLSVYADSVDEPVLRVGFSELTVARQDASLFRFTPPPGATVQDAEQHARQHDGQQPKAGGAKQRPTLVGEGWDTVFVAELPKGRGDERKPAGEDNDGRGADPMALAKQFGEPVTGPWGSGWIVTTKVGAALLTSDGRLAVGAVPQQVLTEAIERAR